MDHGEPILWVKNDRDSHRVVSDQHGTRFESASGSAGRVIAGVFLLVLASLPISFSIYLLSGAEETDLPEVSDECWEYQVEIQVGANPLYCLETLDYSTIISLEVSEDQHIREEIQDIEDDATTYVDTYRWEEVDSSIVYGFIWDGIYNCVRFIPESNLEEDWTVESLPGLYRFSYPLWCGDDYTDEESRTFEEGAHPFDGVWMYDADDPYTMTEFLPRVKVEDNKFSYQLLESKAKVVSDRADSLDVDAIPLGALCCSLPLGLVLLFAADRRRKVFVIDRPNQRITRKRAGSLPSFGTTWSRVDFNSVQLVRSVRIKKHTSGGGEDGPVKHWTTSHPGVNLVLRMEQSIQTLFFFEDGDDLSVHQNVLKDLMKLMGADLEEHADHGVMLNIAESVRGAPIRPTLRYLAESNGVSKWDDDTANFIIGWYYESDPYRPRNYSDPEYMLEPHGNRPYKEMYIRPLYEGAGLTTVRSTEDAQRLLDHLLALRDEKRQEKENEIHAKKATEGATVYETEPSERPAPIDKGGPWGDGPIKEEIPPATVPKDDESKENAPTGSFWSFDEAGEP
mgnify:FL=1